MLCTIPAQDATILGVVACLIRAGHCGTNTIGAEQNCCVCVFHVSDTAVAHDVSDTDVVTTMYAKDDTHYAVLVLLVTYHVGNVVAGAHTDF